MIRFKKTQAFLLIFLLSGAEDSIVSDDPAVVLWMEVGYITSEGLVCSNLI